MKWVNYTHSHSKSWNVTLKLSQIGATDRKVSKNILAIHLLPYERWLSILPFLFLQSWVEERAGEGPGISDSWVDINSIAHHIVGNGLLYAEFWAMVGQIICEK